MPQKPRVLVSACLLGLNCRYDGASKRIGSVSELIEAAELIPICPEQLGGLPTPRTPAERRGERVFNAQGQDVTLAFRRGAEQACRLATLFEARIALIKSGSPSCGYREIYDGNFTARRVPGMGVAAEALSSMGLAIFDENDIGTLLRYLKGDGE